MKYEATTKNSAAAQKVIDEVRCCRLAKEHVADWVNAKIKTVSEKHSLPRPLFKWK